MMTCLLLVAGPAAPTLNTRDIVIPIKIDPQRQKDIRSLILVVSTDQGANWAPATNVSPDATQFSYLAPSDGLYYFAVVVEDLAGKRTPDDPRNTPLKDIQIVQIDTGSAPSRPGVQASPGPDPRASAPPSLPVTPVSRSTERDWRADAVQPVSTKFRESPSSLELPSDRSGGNNIQVPSQGSVRPVIDPTNTLVASSTGRSDAIDYARTTAPSTPASPAHTPMPPIKKLSKRELTLDYTIQSYGPSGVGSVELYITKNDGRTWELFGEPATVNVQAPADARGMAPLRQSLTIVLPGEGVYGFYLITKNKVGLGKAPPQSGQTPDFRVEVDETLPDAKLFRPVPDPEHRDAILLSWLATDNRPLPATPITLEWAEREGGDWHLIGGGELRNTGRFSWQVPPGTPAQVYLRLMVRDEAGNTAFAQTEKPVLIDLTEPDAKISDIRVTGAR
jgi:hypothetical protein